MGAIRTRASRYRWARLDVWGSKTDGRQRISRREAKWRHCVVYLVALTLALVGIARPVAVYDEGLVVTAAQRLLSGEVLRLRS